MSDLAMYDALAALALTRHKHDGRALRRAIFDLESQAKKATSAAHKAGLEHVAATLRKHVDAASPSPSGSGPDSDNAERYP